MKNKLLLLILLFAQCAFAQSFTKGIPQKLDSTASPKFNAINIAGTAGSGYIGLISQSSTPSTPTNAVNIYTNSSNVLSQKDENGRVTEMNGIEIVSTFAGISASTKKRLVIVTADETNGGVTTMYFYTGTALKWVITTDL